MKLHSFPWYPDDWYGKETWLLMSCEERGIYRELLDHCYQEGSLPNSEAILQRRTSATDEEWQRSSGKPLAQFREVDGCLRHHKVDEIRERLLGWREQKSEAGKRSVQARRQRTLNGRSNGNTTNDQTDVERMFKPSTSSTTSTSYSESAKEFIDRYPRRTGTQLGIQTYLSVIEAGEEHAVLEGLDRWKASAAWAQDGGKYVPEPARWLTERRWKEYSAPAQPIGGPMTPPFKESF